MATKQMQERAKAEGRIAANGAAEAWVWLARFNAGYKAEWLRLQDLAYADAVEAEAHRMGLVL